MIKRDHAITKYRDSKELRVVEKLDEKFLHFDYEGYTTYLLHSWEYYGNSNGFELIHRYSGPPPLFSLKTLSESGYAKSDTIRDYDIGNMELVEIWADFFAPTNPNYKTSRK